MHVINSNSALFYLIFLRTTHKFQLAQRVKFSATLMDFSQKCAKNPKVLKQLGEREYNESGRGSVRTGYAKLMTISTNFPVGYSGSVRFA